MYAYRPTSFYSKLNRHRVYLKAVFVPKILLRFFKHLITARVQLGKQLYLVFISLNRKI